MVGNISLWLSTAVGTTTLRRLKIVESPTSDSRFFSVWGLVNSQNPMPNSVVAADAYPVLNGILIPIYYA